MDDKPLPPRPLSSLTETLEAALERVRSVRGVGGNLYRAVEVTLSPDGRLARVGKIWHQDLEHVRRFGHALAANTAGMQVQVTDSRGQVLETIAPPSKDVEPVGWSNWTAIPVPKAPPRPPQPRRRPRPLPAAVPAPVKPPAPRSAPAVVPPVIAQELPVPPPTETSVGAPTLQEPPESPVERTNTLRPGQD